MLKYFLFRIASKLVPALPAWLAYGLAWIGAEVAYHVAHGPRKAVASNLRHVLGPHADSRKLAWAVRGVFHTAAYNYVDMFLIPHISLTRLSERVTVTNPEIFLDSYAQKKGIVLTTAHLGNADLLVQRSVAWGIPVTVLVERLSPEPLFELVRGLRGSHGVRLIPVGPTALREALRVLRSGGVLGIAADRNFQERGMTVPFFGEEAQLPTGAIELALHTGAVVLPVFGLRLPGQRYQISVEQPLELDRTGPDSEVVSRNLLRLVPILERYIREHPEQWIVFEPVWKPASLEDGHRKFDRAEAMGARR